MDSSSTQRHASRVSPEFYQITLYDFFLLVRLNKIEIMIIIFYRLSFVCVLFQFQLYTLLV